MCVKRKSVHPRISVGAISESRRIGGKRNSISPHVKFASPMRIILRLFDQPFSDRVLVAVTNNLVQRFIATNPVVIIVCLPERTGSHEARVDSVRRESFEGLDKP